MDRVQVELEVGFVTVEEGADTVPAIYLSMALSLKRIADALEERNKRDAQEV